MSPQCGGRKPWLITNQDYVATPSYTHRQRVGPGTGIGLSAVPGVVSATPATGHRTPTTRQDYLDYRPPQAPPGVSSFLGGRFSSGMRVSHDAANPGFGLGRVGSGGEQSRPPKWHQWPCLVALLMGGQRLRAERVCLRLQIHTNLRRVRNKRGGVSIHCNRVSWTGHVEGNNTGIWIYIGIYMYVS